MSERELSLEVAPAPRELEQIEPQLVDRRYLQALGVRVNPDDATLAALLRGSRSFARRLQAKTLLPRPRVVLLEASSEAELEIHDYTGHCPTMSYEINPLRGCGIGCLYCLVTDGSHEQQLLLQRNYADLLGQILEREHGEQHYFYFSPKTEAFQPATLQTGVAHEILRAFLRHYEQRPGSKARLFIASKAGADELQSEHQGQRLLDLMAQLSPWMQFNTSLSIMPEALRRVLEPFAAPMEQRLEAVKLCQRHGILANSALIQPIFTPFFDEASVSALFAQLADAGIINFKPELLTVAPENLAMIGQLVGSADKDKERELYESYLAPGNRDHKKQRDRTAPDRARSRLVIDRMLREGDRRGISASVCHWVRKALGISEETIPIVNRNGFQCLGYQTRLFCEGELEGEGRR